jgi:hypothetical protein
MLIMSERLAPKLWRDLREPEFNLLNVTTPLEQTSPDLEESVQPILRALEEMP